MPYILQQSNSCWWSVPDWNLYCTGNWLWWRDHFWLQLCNRGV